MAQVVPSVVDSLVKNPKAKEYDLSSLQLLICGAAPLSANLCESFYNIHKIKIKQCYGYTEASPVTHLGFSEDIVPGSCGVLLPNIECKLISEDGQGINLCFLMFIQTLN